LQKYENWEQKLHMTAKIRGKLQIFVDICIEKSPVNRYKYKFKKSIGEYYRP